MARFDESKVNRDARGRFDDKPGGGFAQRLSDQIGAKRGETASTTRDRETFIAAVMEAGEEFSAANSDGEPDDELEDLLEDLAATDGERKLAIAKMVRNHLISGGYVRAGKFIDFDESNFADLPSASLAKTRADSKDIKARRAIDAELRRRGEWTVGSPNKRANH